MRRSWYLLAVAGPMFPLLFFPGCASNQGAPLSTYRMGDRIVAGRLIYNVMDAQWLPQLGSGTGARVPANRFLVVRLSVMNNGGADAVVPPVTIEDKDGASFAESTDGTGVPQWIGYLRRVKPAEALAGNIVFDVPPHEYRMMLQDGSGQARAVVKIPLAFRSDVPDLMKPPDFPLNEKGSKPEDLRK